MKHVMWIVLVVLLGWMGEAQAAFYLNCGTSEPAVNAASTTLWCDDFENGSWTVSRDDESNPTNDGWRTTIYNVPPDIPAGLFPDPTGTAHAYGRCQVAAGNALVTGLANTGVAGTNCAGTSGFMNMSYTCCQMVTMGDHNFSAKINIANPHLYIRYYRKCVSTNPICGSTGTNTKVAWSLPHTSGEGGLCCFATGAHPDGNSGQGLQRGGGLEVAHGCGTAGQPIHCQSMNLAASLIDLGSGTYRPQNLPTPAGNGTGQDTGNCGISPLETCYEYGNNTDEWYYNEFHIQFESCQGCDDGILEQWADKCGVTGLTGGCATGGTMRARWTNLTWYDGTTGIGAAWLENHAGSNPSHLVGEWYYDQIVASTVRVGPMGGGGDVTPPAAPTNLHFTELGTLTAALENVD